MALRLERIDRVYGRQKALDQVTLEVRRGDCYGFIGHNGAGKTTAMRIMLGLIRPSSGRVIVDGFDAAKYPREARARMGALIERPGFFDQLDGRRNLIRLARLQGLGAAESRAEADRLLDLVGLTQAARKDVGNYSQGMRQRLGIGQAMLGNPDYVLLDEPGNGLDPEGLAEMRELIRSLVRDRGQTVLMSSHQLHDVEEVCNRIGVLKDGVLLLEEESRKIFDGVAPRIEIRSADRAALSSKLDALGFDCERDPQRDDTLSFDPGTRDPEDLLQDLVGDGQKISSFARRAPSLSEIYLGLSDRHTEADATPTAVSTPEEKKAPGMALWRAFRWETTRLFGGFKGWALLLLPSLLAAWNIWTFKNKSQAAYDEAKAAEMMTETITAFPAIAQGLAKSLPLLAIIATMMAAQTLAGELSQGTMRNVLLRPLRRIEVGFGKFLGLAFWTLLSYGLVAATTLGLSALFFDFVGLSEELITGQLFERPGFQREDLMPAVKSVMLAPLLPLGAYVSLGFFSSAFTRRGVGAFVLALTLFVLSDLGRATARSFDVEQWLLGAHFPSLIADSSFLKRYDDLSQGAGNAVLIDDSAALWCGIWWLLGGLVLGLIRFSRRSVS